MKTLTFIENIDDESKKYSLEDTYTLSVHHNCIYIESPNWNLYLFRRRNDQWVLERGGDWISPSRTFTYRELDEHQKRLQDILRVLDIISVELNLTYMSEDERW